MTRSRLEPVLWYLFLASLLALTLGALVLDLRGLAQACGAEPAPLYGASGEGWRVGPRVAAPAAAIDLHTGELSLGVMPGVGYGWERTRGALAPWGVSAFLASRSTARGLRAAPALMLDLQQYVHVGPALVLDGSRTRAYILLTLGTALGSSG